MFLTAGLHSPVEALLDDVALRVCLATEETGGIVSEQGVLPQVTAVLSAAESLSQRIRAQVTQDMTVALSARLAPRSYIDAAQPLGTTFHMAGRGALCTSRVRM